jgi:L-ascorbate metabolism protein UlaG (beta-lactamase superfamily)
MTELLYLRSDTQMEPLFHGWYAWSHLVAPVTSAMNVANAHVKIMRSYLAAPEVHAAAVKNPAMLGGPFIDYEGGRVTDIEAHLAATLTRQQKQLELAQAVVDLDELLSAEGTGMSLEPLYARVPEALRGHVELTYDLRNAAQVRYLEPLLYRSPHYDTSLQSIRLQKSTGDHRAFALSTPRLSSASALDLTLPFASPALDALFRARHTPCDVVALAATLGVAEADMPLFRSFFSDDAPPPREPWLGPGVRVRYFGHACVLIESKDVTILVDPTASYASNAEPRRFSYADLPARIDFVLITHNHQDHFLLETLLQIRHRVGTVIVPRGNAGALEDPQLTLVLRALGFASVHELDMLDTCDIPGGQITGVPFLGEHADLRVASKLAYIVELPGFRALFAADSNNLAPELYDHVRRCVGPTPIVFVGLECDGAPLSWLYGPLLSKPITRKMDQSRRLSGSDFERADRLVQQMGAEEVFVYALGQEPWLGYIMSVKYTESSRPIVCSEQLIAACQARGHTAARLYGTMEKVWGA